MEKEGAQYNNVFFEMCSIRRPKIVNFMQDAYSLMRGCGQTPPADTFVKAIGNKTKLQPAVRSARCDKKHLPLLKTSILASS